MKRTLLALVFLTLQTAFAQGTFPFHLVLEPISITNLPGIQSYAVAEYDGKWLIVGGRTDGLHQRQPWQAFNSAGNNLKMYVVDPVGKTVHSALVSGLNNDSVVAQLTSTNPNYIQKGNHLFFLGGYGLSSTSVHITHPRLTVIDVPTMMSAIVANAAVDTTAYTTIANESFAVTGGKLLELNDTYFLVGGQRFDGQYNPMGHNTYVQSYTNQVLPFEINGTFPTLSATFGSPIIDTVELHRRDYNVTYMMDDTETYFTAWSGVFQKTADLPYLNAVEVRDSGIYPVPGFSQYLNHYHCATSSLYAEDLGAMYTVFYGGIAQYFYDNGTLTQDNNVPFVKTIGVVEKKNGTYSEHYLSNQLPGYLGAGAEFMPNLELARNGEILITDSIGTDTTLIGYIFGGISSPAANVFYNGQTNTSIATPNIYKVSLARFTGIGVEEALTDDDLGLAIKPYTDQRSLLVQISGFMDGETNFAITDTSGRLTYETFVPTKLGRNTIELGDFNAARGTYVLTATQGGKSQRIKFVW